MDRRSVLTGIAASAWLPPSADALGFADDKIKIVRYFSNSGDTQGHGVPARAASRRARS